MTPKEFCVEFPPDWERMSVLEWMADALRGPLLDRSHEAFMERDDAAVEVAFSTVASFDKGLRIEAALAGGEQKEGGILWKIQASVEADPESATRMEEIWGRQTLQEPEKGPWAEGIGQANRRSFALLRAFVEAGAPSGAKMAI